MTEAQDTVGERLNQAFALIVALQVAEDTDERLVPKILQGSLYSVQTLLEQAQGAFKEVCHQATPGQPGKLRSDNTIIDEYQNLASGRVIEVRDFLFKRREKFKKGTKKWRALDEQIAKLEIANDEIGSIGIIVVLRAGKSIDQIMDELEPGLLTD